MKAPKRPTLSVVVPLYNEQAAVQAFHDSLEAVLRQLDMPYEILFVNDGSSDDTFAILEAIAEADAAVRILTLTRNFGKEVATTAGLHEATGHAIITIDADGQHPVELIPEFIAKWKLGAKVVIGVRTANQREGLVKRWGSRLFRVTMNRLSDIRIVPGSTDYRLVDQSVQQEFKRMTERNRITRGLIDWLGYQRDYISFVANPRLAGDAGYSFRPLVKLYIDSVVSLSISPLYIAAYLGVIVLPASTLLGLGMVINAIFGDPLGLHATGGAYVLVLVLFLIGVLLVSQGIIGLYLSHIHTETQNRPLYVIDEDRSRRNI